MKKLFAALMTIVLTSNGYAQQEIYTVESAANGINLIVNGMEFAAKDYCPDYLFGDTVIFLSGDPKGLCTDAFLLNLRNNLGCDVWCQQPL